MKNLWEKLVAGAFCLALLLLTGVGLASYLSVQRLIENKQRLEHTSQVLENLEKISDGLKDAQGGRRGYILTREAIFIKTYRRGSKTTQQGLKALRKLTIDNPRQHRRLDEIEPIVTKRLAVLLQSIQMVQKNKYNRQPEINITNLGEKAQQELQEKIAVMEQEERILLQQLSAAADASVKNTISVFIVGYSSSFFLLFGVYFLLKKEIRDRTKAEAALQLSQSELKTLLENSPDVIIRVDRELRHTYVNSALEQEAGIPPAAFIGKTFSELGFSAELTEFLQASHQQVFATGKMNVVEFDYPSPKGVKLIQSLIVPEFATDGSVASTLSLSRDITPLKQAQLALETAKEELEMRVEERTARLLEINQALEAEIEERHQAEEALYQSNCILNSVLESIPDIVFVKDLQGRYVLANSIAASWLGVSGAEMLGKHDTELLPAEIAQKFIQKDRIITTTGESLIYEELIPKQGVMEALLTMKCPWRDSQGNIIGVIGISRDLSELQQAESALQQARDQEIRVQERTKELSEANGALQVEIAERKEAERKLQQLMLDLQRSNQELEQFAYLASHDLQEPLRAVMGYTELLEQEYKQHLDETAKEYMGYIIDGATRMRQLIQDLLAYSRVGTRGKAFMPTDSNGALRQALNDLQLAIASDNATITYDRLPRVYADKAQLAQLFQNLIGNAIKFRREEPPQIHIWAEPKEHQWVFGVRDNGIGIKPRYLERIFELFKRLHTRKEFPGTGMGLAICKKIVERHGGTIWAESEPGVGTTFYFTLPRQDMNRQSSLCTSSSDDSV